MRPVIKLCRRQRLDNIRKRRILQFPSPDEEFSIAELRCECVFRHMSLVKCRSGCQRSPDIDFRFQSLVNRTTFGNVKEAAFSVLVEVAAQFNLTIDRSEERR